MDPRTSLDTKECRKISTPSTPGIEPGPSSPQSSALPLEPPGPYTFMALTLGLHGRIANIQYTVIPNLGHERITWWHRQSEFKKMHVIPYD